MTDQLPWGWSETRLRDVVVKTLGGDWGKSADEAPADFAEVAVVRGAEFRTWGAERARTAPLRRIKPTSLENRQLQEGDLVVEVSGGGPTQPVGRVLLVDADALRSSTAPLVCTNFCRQVRLSKELYPRWVELALRRLYAAGAMTAIQTNTTNLRNLNFEDFLDLELPLPPLTEQRRIVAKLEELMARSRRAKDALDAVPPLLDQLRQSILAAAFRGDLTADWRAKNPNVEPAEKLIAHIRGEHRRRWEDAELARLAAKGKYPSGENWKAKYPDPEPPPADASTLLGLPPSWQPVALDLIRAGDAPMVYGIILPGDDVPDGVPYVRPVDIGADGAVDVRSLKRTSVEIAEQYARASLRAGDIILSIVGTIGKVAVVPSEIAGGNITQSSIRIRPGCGTSAEFLRWVLQAPCLVRQYDRFRFGNAVQRLNVEHVRQLYVPLPPFEEQVEICKRIQAAQARVNAIGADAMLAELARFESSVLAKAFRGELVPQDPSDEPASVLLKRIRAARDSAEAGGQRRRFPMADEVVAKRGELDDDGGAPAPSLRSAPDRRAPNGINELDQEALCDEVFAALWTRGPLEKDDAVRQVAEHLRAAGHVEFQRLRSDGPLYAQFLGFIEAAVKAGRLDRPKRGQVRACKADATTFTADDWRHALVASVGTEPVDREEAIRVAAEWARDNLGLEFARLRSDGHIVEGLRSAINSAIRRGEVVRRGTNQVCRAPVEGGATNHLVPPSGGVRTAKAQSDTEQQP